MPNWAWFLTGVAATHVLYAIWFLTIWYRLVRQSGQPIITAIHDDVAAILAGFRRPKNASQN